MNKNTSDVSATDQGLLHKLESWLFGNRKLVLGIFGAITVIMGIFAVQLRMEAGFEKQLPVGHEYIETYETYQKDLLSANRLTVVVKARDGSIWTQDGLKRLYDVTQAVKFLPNVSRGSVQSIWTPNVFVNEITEEGFRADPLVPGTVTPEALDEVTIAKIQESTFRGGFVGKLIDRDQKSAMITIDLIELDNFGNHIDYSDFNKVLESDLRKKFEDDKYEIMIIGFAKQTGDISDGAESVVKFCVLAFALTALAVYWYCHSIPFTIIALTCSLVSLVWQFGALRLLGFGLDPLAVLVPFLVFAIGVSHGVQQINYIVREISTGKTASEAARASFTGLLIPGTLALVTAFVSFITLLLIPIPMVRELAITASLGVAFKIITNLVMLPLVASMIHVTKEYAESEEQSRLRRSKWLHSVATLAEPRKAKIVLIAAVVLMGVSAWQSSDRVIGTLQAGAPELKADARYNTDSVMIASNYDVGLDWLTVVFEADPEYAKKSGIASCDRAEIGYFQDRFVWAMTPVPGVVSISSFSTTVRQYNEGYNEGNPKMDAVPIDPTVFASLGAEVGRVPGLMRNDCTMTAVNLFLTDHKAVTLQTVIAAVEAFRKDNSLPGVTIRLAAGNGGILAAINDEVEKSELPMMLYVYAAIALLVIAVYRDWRAVLICCLPLTIGTFLGYWFMKSFEIGLTVATLPVMVLAVGIGVDYAFYIYNRLQFHMADGETIVKAVEQSIMEVGVATIFTAITLAIGVATWSFSSLKFQADMGKLLAFMFMVNMVMAMTVLPAFAVWLEMTFKRTKPIRKLSILNH